MTAGVYAIVNTNTGKAYVGSSKNINVRWGGRRGELNRGVSRNKPLQTDWTATKGAGFELRVLEVTEPDDAALMAAEDRWIGTFGAAASGVYNQRGANVGRHGAHSHRKRKGWGWGRKGRKYHYFLTLYSASICGGVERSHWGELDNTLHDSPDNCVKCQKLRPEIPKRRRPQQQPGESG